MIRMSVLVLAALFFVAAQSAEACSFNRIMYFRDSAQQDWKVFNEGASDEIAANIYGFMNSMNNDKTVLDYFFWKIRCQDVGAAANVILEQNTIPLTSNWETQWSNDFNFNYGETYKWTQAIGTREFLFVFQFKL